MPGSSGRHWEPRSASPPAGWAPIPEKNTRLLRELGPLVGVSRAEVDRVRAGRGTAEQVRRLTDALLRAGKLPSEPRDAPAPLRVRKMMFEYGIGVDCAGYVQQATAAARALPLEKVRPARRSAAIAPSWPKRGRRTTEKSSW